MATNRDLLKEAIADAKAVKEMAIANAKSALEESFTPHLKSMLAAKIQEMDEMEEEVEEGKMAMYDEDDTEPMKEEEVSEELDLEEVLAELEESEEEEEMVNEVETEETEEVEEEDMEVEMETETEEEDLDIEDMSEEDLKSFIEDVIADMVEAGELEAGDSTEEVEVEDEGEEMEMDSDEDEMEMDEEEEEVNLDELLAEIDSMEEAEEIEEAGFGKMPADSDEGFSDMEEKALDEVTEYEELEEIFGFGKKGSGGTKFVKDFIEANDDAMEAAEGDEDEMKKLITKFYNENVRKMDGSALRSDISVLRLALGMGELGGKTSRASQLESDLSEAIETIETLKSEINEVNLLNAKLLYTNKIFKGKNLTESQKVKVLNTFDKATTVKEVKLVFETLNEGVKTNKKTISENLGSASKAMGTSKKPIIEANDAFSRMREIAFYSAKH